MALITIPILISKAFLRAKLASVNISLRTGILADSVIFVSRFGARSNASFKEAVPYQTWWT